MMNIKNCPSNSGGKSGDQIRFSGDQILNLIQLFESNVSHSIDYQHYRNLLNAQCKDI